MPFINANLNDARESEVVPEGTYDVRIHSCDEMESKKGKAMLKVICVIESQDHPNAAPIIEYLSLPHEDDTEQASKFKLLQLARFCALFEIPFEDNGFDTDDFAGASASEVLVKQETFEEEGKTPFVSNKLILPRLKSEPAEDQAPSRKRAGAKRR